MFNANMGLSYDFDSGNSMGIRYEFERTPKSNYEANSNIDLTVTTQSSEKGTHIQRRTTS